ncbi:MAG: CsbD family protein [Actinomycetota bacterium]
MSMDKKFAHKAKVAKGSWKQRIGRLTGNKRMQAEGRRDKFTGKSKLTWEKVKASVRR